MRGRVFFHEYRKSQCFDPIGLTRSTRPATAASDMSRFASLGWRAASWVAVNRIFTGLVDRWWTSSIAMVCNVTLRAATNQSQKEEFTELARLEKIALFIG